MHKVGGGLAVKGQESADCCSLHFRHFKVKLGSIALMSGFHLPLCVPILFTEMLKEAKKLIK